MAPGLDDVGCNDRRGGLQRTPVRTLVIENSVVEYRVSMVCTKLRRFFARDCFRAATVYDGIPSDLLGYALAIATKPAPEPETGCMLSDNNRAAT